MDAFVTRTPRSPPKDAAASDAAAAEKLRAEGHPAFKAPPIVRNQGEDTDGLVMIDMLLRTRERGDGWRREALAHIETKKELEMLRMNLNLYFGGEGKGTWWDPISLEPQPASIPPPEEWTR